MLGLDWQAMLVWMAAGQSYPCLLLYAHCVHCTRIVCIVRARLLRLNTATCCTVSLYCPILATACESYPLLSTWLQFAKILHFREILVPRSSISSYESEWRTLCSTAEETRGQCSRVENIIPASSRHAPSPLHMSATTATNPLNYDTKWCSYGIHIIKRVDMEGVDRSRFCAFQNVSVHPKQLRKLGVFFHRKMSETLLARSFIGQSNSERRSKLLQWVKAVVIPIKATCCTAIFGFHFIYKVMKRFVVRKGYKWWVSSYALQSAKPI